MLNEVYCIEGLYFECIKIALGVNILTNIIICKLEVWRDGVVLLKTVYEKYKYIIDAFFFPFYILNNKRVNYTYSV